MDTYTKLSTKELVSIWKKILDGDKEEAEKVLIQRIKLKGTDSADGPAKVVYLHNGKLKWTFLTAHQRCKNPCIAYDPD